MLGILLAAGKGTRMQADFPKVLFPINEEPMAFQPLKTLYDLCEKVIVVIGFCGPDVKQALLSRAKEIIENFDENKLLFFTQEEQKGTADAVKTALTGYLHTQGDIAKEILVLNGDLPLISKVTLLPFIKNVHKERLETACLSFKTLNPQGLGRILRDHRGFLCGIREEKDATVEEKKIQEVNSGVYFFKTEVLEKILPGLRTENIQKEFYLTDVFADSSNTRKEALLCNKTEELQGINNHYELALVRKKAQEKLQKTLGIEKGVEFLDPNSTFVSAHVNFEGSCQIGPSTQLKGKCHIARGVKIIGNSWIEDTEIGENALIDWTCVLRKAKIMREAQIGPLAHLRPGSVVMEKAKVGNFVEMKASTLGAGAKASHLSYLGDAEIGENTNIGCGTITCNYDGLQKHKTIVGKNAFIGSDTQLIAPVKIGDEAYIASGTALTQDIPAGALALSRPELIVKEGYAKKLLSKLKESKKNQSKGSS